MSGPRVICTQCALEAQRVEPVVEEMDKGGMLAVFVVGRVFYHVHENGNKKVCKEKLPNGPFMLMCCGGEEAQRARETYRAHIARRQFQQMLRVV